MLSMPRRVKHVLLAIPGIHDHAATYDALLFHRHGRQGSQVSELIKLEEELT